MEAQHDTVALDFDIDDMANKIMAELRELTSRENKVLYHQDAAKTAAEAASMVRIEIGKKLIRVRAAWPQSGPRAKGWGEFLRRINLDDVTAWRYMEIAGFRRSPAPPPASSLSLVKENSVPEPDVEVYPDALVVPAEAPEAGDDVEIDRDTWCTPQWITDALGEVDLDPCANERSHVQARETYRLDHGQDGLELAIGVASDARTFVNPPYSRGSLEKWVAAYKHTRFCFLVKFDPSTKWFAELFAATSRVLFPRGTRIEFEAPEGVPPNKAGANQFPHALFFARAGDAPAALVDQCFDWITTNTD